MHCPRCGAANADAATACVACGSPLAPLAPAHPAGAAAWAPPQGPRQRPTGVTLIAVYDFVAAAVIGLFAIGAMAFLSIFGAVLGALFGGGDGGIAAVVILIGFFLLAIAALHGVLGWAVLQGKGWARIVQIVLAVLSVLGLFTSLAGSAAFDGGGLSVGWNVIQGVLGAVILWYLFQPEAKRHFGAA